MSVSISSSDQLFLTELMRRYPDKLSRLRGGFYSIKDKTGRSIPFRMNAAQERFIANRHDFDIVLKARQAGYTTLIQLDMLDDCLFISNTSAGVIAHNLNDAKAFFSDKIKFAADSLPEPFKRIRGATTDNADSLKFNNGSSIRVGVSLRSGTLQRLHVSEFGKLCAKFPERAKEVIAGAFNTVSVGQRITVESTAEGRAGYFYDMCMAAQRAQASSKPLTPLDFKFHFEPWFADNTYEFPDEIADMVTETSAMTEYFATIEQKTGVTLSRNKRAWYIKKAEQQGDKMKQEFPSTPEEAFEASVEGAYFAQQMLKLRKRGGICRIPILDREVHTTWDLGVNDDMAITFWQTVGPEERAIDFYKNSGEGMAHYAGVLKDKGYNYSRHHLPHDGDQRRLGVVVSTPREQAIECGIRPVTVEKRINREIDGVNASRAFLAKVWIDEVRCAELIDGLDNYRKAWDEKLGVFKDVPVHDEFSHSYKSFETAAIRPELFAYEEEDDHRNERRSANDCGY